MGTAYLTKEQKARLEYALKQFIDEALCVWKDDPEYINIVTLAGAIQKLQWLEEQDSQYD